MKKVYLTWLFILILGYCNGQDLNRTDYIKHNIDSLDRIQFNTLNRKKASDKSYIIKVSNQQGFNTIDEQIKKAINGGETNIVVKMGPGIYHFHENHIYLCDFECENVSISIQGSNTIITSNNDYYKDENYFSPWHDLRRADNTIKVIDEKQNLCFLPYKNTYSPEDKENFKKIQVTQWFRAPKYTIDSIDEEGVYFIAPGLQLLKQNGREGYNVNYDYIYAGKTPRFRLYDKNREQQYEASCFLRVSNVSLMSIELKGVNVCGNKEGSSLISMTSVNSSLIMIRKCTFSEINGQVAGFIKTDNVVFDENEISKTTGNELSFTAGCKNVRVTRNFFTNGGNDLGNSMCVRCCESEYYIGYNFFCDFGYCAVGLGLWYGHEKKYDTRGIVEYNEIYFSQSYYNQKEKYTLMDAGAIYVCTQNEDAIIRYNYIHDYIGEKDYRGIFCDDGACNLSIYGNIILNTPNGHSIDSRKAKDQRKGFTNNSNNFMASNVVDGSVRFQGYGDENRHCRKGANFVLIGHENTSLQNKFDNLEMLEEDIYINNIQCRKKIRSFYRNRNKNLKYNFI